jgi:predicted permease
LVRLLSLDPGFAVHDVAAARVSAYAERYPDRASTVSFFRELVGRARALPPVAAAAASSSLPLSGLGSGTAVAAFGRPVALNDQTTAGWQVVTPGYFGTVGISIVAGRDFTPDEVDRGAHVSIISASLAETLYPGEDPIGKRMTSGGGDDWHEVVGVAGDVRHLALAASPSPRVYDLIGQHWSRTLFLVARTDGSANALIPAMRGVVRDLDASAPLFEAATMTELVSRSTATFTLASRVASGLAVASLLIALLGVYGVILSNAASRTREFGVRIALGARPRDLRTRVLREHAQMLLAGGILGLGASIVTVRLLEALLYGVDTADAAAVAAAIALALAVVAIGTALLATRKASAVDPLVALRD